MADVTREDVEEIRRNPPQRPSTNEEMRAEEGSGTWFRTIPEVLTLLAYIDHLEGVVEELASLVEFARSTHPDECTCRVCSPWPGEANRWRRMIGKARSAPEEEA